MCEDYRNTKYCPSLEELENKKNYIVEMIKTDHKRAIDMHTYISDNSDKYKMEFIKAYNGKCSYCGVSLDLIPKSSFQIDHYIYQKSDEFQGSKARAGTIDNLVLSCDKCNHNKSSFPIPISDREKLHPDKGLGKTFYRNEEYYICVNKEHQTNSTIEDFYNKVKLGNEIHRLDYLLMNIIGLQQKLNSEHPAYSQLGLAIEILKKKRNIMA